MRRAGAVFAGLVALAGAPAAAQAPGGRFYLEQTGRAPDGPETQAEAAYDARLRESLVQALRLEGPLAGGWTLEGPDGGLFALELSQRDDEVEGAWRDLRRPAALNAWGFVERTTAGPATLTLNFGGRTAVLRPAGAGWQGELVEPERTLPVILRPTGP
jgi:hypothetical protein